ncbi:MAG: hypothetical protein RL516_504 [Bacteroidota bacterium]|jgi:hypothetical protein
MKKIFFVLGLILTTSLSQAQICPVVITHIINGNQVQYYGSCSSNPSGWSWFFNGGSPLTSSQQNPVVNYSAPGQYITALSVYGGPNSCSAALSNKNDTVVIVSTGIDNMIADGFSMNVIQAQNPQLEIINNKSQKVQVSLHDLNGQLIETVFEGVLSQGKNLLSIQTFNIPAGVYLISLSKEDGVISKRILIN